MEYDICKWYADKGDTVWYVNHFGDIIKAKVSGRSFWEPEQVRDPHFLKRYWIEPSNVTWWEKLIDNVRWWWYNHYSDENEWIVNPKYPGKAVELGNEIYLTKQEAEEAVWDVCDQS